MDLLLDQQSSFEVTLLGSSQEGQGLFVHVCITHRCLAIENVEKRNAVWFQKQHIKSSFP